ncbi:hypothetical protein BC351_00265 [Paenibacillus ferrarius]|uniref:Uncharacterized protein n=1 Tax=Paenibacillus ferrarius TaxID=1469647 RepID=A0A1V4HS10_9BACL|nr:phage tail spike protein [Paenibacillus ferrarius]OPH61711.1 hypothetical protein BC351_00265 [Paenibacillus ferrarius]
MLQEIDYTRVNEYRPRISLCDPLKKTLSILKEAYEINQVTKLGNINNLSFRIPYNLEIQHKLVRNKNADLIKERLLIKIQKKTEFEYYVITQISDIMTDNEDYKEVTCESLAMQLSWRNIRGYSEISKTATEILTDILVGTGWSVGSVDSSFNQMRRSPTVDDDTVLGTVFKVAETFNALVVFNSINQTISFTKIDVVAPYEGLNVSFGRLLKNANKTEDMSEFCTRLKVFGKDGLTLSGITAAGSNYLENYSFYLFPFTQDVNGNVTKSSYYMSDSLASALVAYQKKSVAASGTLQGYLAQKVALQATKTSQENVLYGYKNELAIINDQLVVANANSQNNSTIIANKAAKEAQIAAQNSLIATTKSSINAVDSNILTLKNSLSIANNFTQAQVNEWQRGGYINERTYTNDLVDNETELLKLATAEFDKIREPKILLEIDIVDLFSVITEQKMWPKVRLGAQIKVYVEKLDINIKATIIQLEQNYESDTIKVTISNVQEFKDEDTQLLKKLYGSISAANTLTTEKYGWRDARVNVDAVNIKLSNPWDSSTVPVKGGYDETIEISHRGIIMTSPTDSNNMLILNHATLAISNDSGLNWQNSITPNGINATSIRVGELFGINATIGTGNNVFKMNQSGISLGNSTFSSAPFRVDMQGNLFSNSANITGTINATGGTLGNLTVTGTLSGGSIFGSQIVGSDIRTSNFSFPRVELKSSGNLINVMRDASNYLSFDPYASGAPAINFLDSGSVMASIKYVSSFGLMLASFGKMTLQASSGIDISSITNFPSWSNLFASSGSSGGGRTLATELGIINSRLAALEARPPI